VLGGDARELDAALAAHRQALEGDLQQIARRLGKVQALRDGLARGEMPTAGDLRALLDVSPGPGVGFHLPWPWAGEWFELPEVRPLSYIIGPLGSGKTRFARCLAEAFAGGLFLGLERADSSHGAAGYPPGTEPASKPRIEAALAGLIDEGAARSDALIDLLAALETDGAAAVVIDMLEHGLDAATQGALIRYLRQRARAGAPCPVFFTTRSSVILDLAAVGPDETILLCPANHSPPIRVAPHPGARGHEAVATCLASPEVRARTAGVTVARRPALA
jgi:hypothetical protein